MLRDDSPLTASAGDRILPKCSTAKNRHLSLRSMGDDHAQATPLGLQGGDCGRGDGHAPGEAALNFRHSSIAAPTSDEQAGRFAFGDA